MKDFYLTGLPQGSYPQMTYATDVIQSVVITAANTVLTGTIDATASTAVVGVGTLFTTELVIGDYILVSGEIRRVVTITDNLNLTVDTAFTDTGIDTSPEIVKGKAIDIPTDAQFAQFTSDVNFYATFDGTVPTVPGDTTSSVATVSVLNPTIKHVGIETLIRIDAPILGHVTVEFFA